MYWGQKEGFSYPWMLACLVIWVFCLFWFLVGCLVWFDFFWGGVQVFLFGLVLERGCLFLGFFLSFCLKDNSFRNTTEKGRKTGKEDWKSNEKFEGRWICCLKFSTKFWLPENFFHCILVDFQVTKKCINFYRVMMNVCKAHLLFKSMNKNQWIRMQLESQKAANSCKIC